MGGKDPGGGERIEGMGGIGMFGVQQDLRMRGLPSLVGTGKDLVSSLDSCRKSKLLIETGIESGIGNIIAFGHAMTQEGDYPTHSEWMRILKW